jgi:hypothetical protein
MKPIPERNWRPASDRVAHAWSRNHWINSHRSRPRGQRTRDAGWTAIDTPYVPLPPATAAARVGPARRQRAAESDWENEGGAIPQLAPGYGKLGE